MGWTGNVGVPGGIPNRSTIYTNLNPGATTVQIQAAITACPSNQVILLNAGTYNLSELDMTRSFVTLRGSVDSNGAPTTIINASGNGVMIGDYGPFYNEWQSSPVAANHVGWTGGLAQGSTVITVSNTPGMAVGKLIFLDQTNDADTTAYSPVNIGPCNPVSPTNDDCYPTEYTSVLHPGRGYDRIQFQVNRIKAINGNQVTLTEPVYMPNWNAANLPQAWCFSTSTQPYEGVGVENIKFNHPNGIGVAVYWTYGCWVRNCVFDGMGSCTAHQQGAAVFLWNALRCEVRHNYMVNADAGSCDFYGICTRDAAGLLIEDNILNRHGTMLMVDGVSGSVYAYNYDTGIDLDSAGYFMRAGILTHGGAPNMCLFEGNYGIEIQEDSTWQNSAYLVTLRNRLTGRQADTTKDMGNVQAAAVMERHHHESWIANILGTPGYHTIYQDTDGTGGCHDPLDASQPHRVWYIGNRGGGNDCGDNYDSLSYSTLIRAVNWDSATSGIVSNGYAPSDVPNSYYLTSKPANFGSLPWPPFDPTKGASVSYINIPAGYRYVNGADPPTTPIAPPAAPANLIVQ